MEGHLLQEPDSLLPWNLPRGNSLQSREGARVLLLGGLPFPETILMWWNFAARAPEEIAEARTAWEKRQRFGDVKACSGPRLSARR